MAAGSGLLGVVGTVTTTVAPEARLLGIAAIILAFGGCVSVIVNSLSRAYRRIKHPELPEEK